MDWDELRQRIAGLEYPDNHCYDPETMEPEGKLVKRLEVLRTNAPELFAAGESFLEIGSNKGYFCLTLAGTYDRVTGYDKAGEYVEFCRDLQEKRGVENAEFIHGEFRDVPFPRETKDRWDTVYVANCHHYLFFDCAKSSAPPLLFLKKLAGLCDKHLIIDGPLEMSDPAVTKLSGEGSWSDWVRNQYTFDRYVEHLKPQFELVRVADNGLGRTTAVFRRAEEDMPHLDCTDLRKELIRQGVPVDCNPRRGPDSCFRHEGKRYKFDLNPVPDSVFLILNALAPWTAHTSRVLEYTVKGNRARVGDVAEWIDGEPVDDPRRLLEHILWWNQVLGTVGLIQCDFEKSDFKTRPDTGAIVNVDVDMIRHISQLQVDIVGDLPIHGLMRTKAGGCKMAPGAIDKMLANLGKKRIFDEIRQEGNWYVGDGEDDA